MRVCMNGLIFLCCESFLTSGWWVELYTAFIRSFPFVWGCTALFQPTIYSYIADKRMVLERRCFKKMTFSSCG